MVTSFLNSTHTDSTGAIDLQDNALSGELPSQLGSTQLGKFELPFDTPVLASCSIYRFELFPFCSTVSLRLQQNRLVGAIPSELGILSSLGSCRWFLFSTWLQLHWLSSCPLMPRCRITVAIRKWFHKNAIRAWIHCQLK
jgi:hypothetical protein